MLQNNGEHMEQGSGFGEVKLEWEIAIKSGDFREYLLALDSYLLSGAATTLFTFHDGLSKKMETVSDKITPLVYDENTGPVSREMVMSSGLDIETLEKDLGNGHTNIVTVSRKVAQGVFERTKSES